MPLQLLDRAWDPDSPANADWFLATAGTAVLLDGAATRAEERVSRAANDTVWLVRRFADEFARSAAGDVPERVERARALLSREYAALCIAASLTPSESPFACLAIVEHAAERLELFNMGDQTTLVRLCDGSVQRFGESAVRELDRRALAQLGRERDAGVEPHAERLARIGPLLLSHRAQRNRLPGYDVLDVSSGGAERFERRSLEAAVARDVLMMTDGFYRLVDTFGCYTDATLFAALERLGLAALLAQLREIERGDPECTKYLRCKPHDDATALWLTLA
jgi:hypothetical protein